MGLAKHPIVFDLRLVRSRCLDILDLETTLVNLEDVFDEVARLRNLVEAMIRAREAQDIQDQAERAAPEAAVGANSQRDQLG